jgi:tetratricopeptide (TPR) repeat protein
MIAYKKARELSEDKASWILSNIGNIMNNKGFYTEAIISLKKGLELDPDSQYSCERLGQAMKNKEEERKKFDTYCKEGRKLIREYFNN